MGPEERNLEWVSYQRPGFKEGVAIPRKSLITCSGVSAVWGKVGCVDSELIFVKVIREESVLL